MVSSPPGVAVRIRFVAGKGASIVNTQVQIVETDAQSVAVLRR